MSRRFKLVFLSLIILAVALYCTTPFILTAAANHLVVKDKLENADLILVLGGDDNGERVDEAVKLYKQGYAKKILMSGGPLAWHLTVAQLMKKQAEMSGIQSTSILIQDRSRSTVEDARFSLPIVKERAIKSIILVTSPTHTRRAGRVFNKIFTKEGIKVIVRPAEKSSFVADRWWTRHEDTGLVVWEYVASVLYFLKGY